MPLGKHPALLLALSPGVHGASGPASQAAASRSTAQKMDAGGSARPIKQPLKYSSTYSH